MKQLFSSLLLLFFTAFAMSQAPQSFNYQGVARNASGAPYANQQISVRLSIHTGTANGAVEYSETRSVETNQFGLFNVQIGSAGAANVQGNFTAIKWSEGPKFLQTELSVSGQPYLNLGTTQMMSVPYSIHSKEAKQLVFPFDTTVTGLQHPAFAIRNKSENNQATMVLENETGNTFYSISKKGFGIIAQTSAKNMAGISGISLADSAIGVMGSAHFIYKDGVGVLGEGGLNNNGVRGISTNRAGVQGFSTNNYGVYGESKDFVAIGGSSTNMAGVTGTSVNGIGIVGLSETGAGAIYGSGGQYSSSNQFGVMGEAFGNSTGVLAKSNSTSATALLVDGKIRITNNGSLPGNGKVLTSDAQGNATWQNPVAVAFRASSLRNETTQSFADGVAKKVLFHQSVRYNIGNAYDGENAIFFVPQAGIYYLHAQVQWQGSSPWAAMRLAMLRNGVVSYIAESICGSYTSSDATTTPSVTTTIALQPNDAIWVELTQSNNAGNSKLLGPGGWQNYFTGHLVTIQ